MLSDNKLESAIKGKHNKEMIYRRYIKDEEIITLFDKTFSEEDNAEHIYLEGQYEWLRQFAYGESYRAIKLEKDDSTYFLLAGFNSRGIKKISQGVCFIRQQEGMWFFYHEFPTSMGLLSFQMNKTPEESRLDFISKMIIDFKGKIETEGLNGEDEKMALLRNATMALNEFANLALRKSPDLIKRTVENDPR